MSQRWYPAGVPVRRLVHVPSRRGDKGAGAGAPASGLHGQERGLHGQDGSRRGRWRRWRRWRWPRFASARAKGASGAMGARKGNLRAEGAVQPGDAGLDDRGQEVGERLPGDRGDVRRVQARGGDRDCGQEGGRCRGARGIQGRNCKGGRRQEEAARVRWPDRPVGWQLCRRGGGLRGGVNKMISQLK